jgi:prolyl-tRNA synthetase
MLSVSPSSIVKTLLYETDDGVVAVAIRGDREVNEIKLLNFLDGKLVRLAGEATVQRVSDAPVGFAGPVGLSREVRLLADLTTRDLGSFVCGANKGDAHFVGAEWGRDATPEVFHDFLQVQGEDPCPRCEGQLESFRGIEVGHIFKLGTKYSEAMACHFSDEKGESHPMLMGCYGLGIGRTVAAAIEQNHDKDGIVWPLPLAPFEVLLVALNPNDEQVREVTEKIYQELLDGGVDVFFDDRDERPGVKFKDADLVGIPHRIVVGARSLAEGKVEVSTRRDGEKVPVPVVDVVATVVERLNAERGAPA